jgi:hypothetical protein
MELSPCNVRSRSAKWKFEIAGVVLTEMNVSRTVEFKNLVSFKREFSFGKGQNSHGNIGNNYLFILRIIKHKNTL